MRRPPFNPSLPLFVPLPSLPSIPFPPFTPPCCLSPAPLPLTPLSHLSTLPFPFSIPRCVFPIPSSISPASVLSASFYALKSLSSVVSVSSILVLHPFMPYSAPRLSFISFLQRSHLTVHSRIPNLFVSLSAPTVAARRYHLAAGKCI